MIRFNLNNFNYYKEKYIPFLVIFIVLWLHNSFYMQQIVSGKMRTFLPFIFGIILLFLIKIKNFKMNKNKLLITFYFIISYTISSLLNSRDILSDHMISYYLTICTALILSECCKFYDFYNAFNKIMAVICLISILFFFIEMYKPEILKLIPGNLVLEVPKRPGDKIYLFNFFVTARNSGYYRNHGIFVEPGMFQIYINIALMFELFLKRRINWIHVFIYCFAMASCLSTTGLLIMGFIFIVFILQRSTWRNRKTVFFLIMLSLLIYILLFGNLLGEQILFNLQKVSQLNDEVTFNSISSGAERNRALKIAADAFLQKPVFGHANAFETYSIWRTGKVIILTFTSMNWFAYGGILFGLIWNFCYLRIIKFFPISKVAKFLLSFILILLVSTQSMEFNLFMTTLCFWGISYQCKNKEQKFKSLG